jgi:hypothetical protein
MRGASCQVPSGNAERPGFHPTIVLHARVLTGPVGAVCQAGFSFAKGLKRWVTRRENSAVVLDFRGDTAGPSRRNLVFEITYSSEFVFAGSLNDTPSAVVSGNAAVADACNVAMLVAELTPLVPID